MQLTNDVFIGQTNVVLSYAMVQRRSIEVPKLLISLSQHMGSHGVMQV